MNQEKISRAIELQNRANDQIETYGEALDSTVNELMNIIDNMTPEEEMNSQPSIWQHKLLENVISIAQTKLKTFENYGFPISLFCFCLRFLGRWFLLNPNNKVC